MTEYINLELSGNHKENDKLTKRPYLHGTTATATTASTANTTTITTTTTITKTYISVANTTKAEDIEKKDLRRY